MRQNINFREKKQQQQHNFTVEFAGAGVFSEMTHTPTSKKPRAKAYVKKTEM